MVKTMQSTDNYQLYFYYFYMLETLDESFQFVIDGYKNQEYEESEKIFSQIMEAFYDIDSSNSAILTASEKDDELISEILKFDSVIFELEKMDSAQEYPFASETYIKNELAPAFKAWKEAVQNRMQRYILQ